MAKFRKVQTELGMKLNLSLSALTFPFVVLEDSAERADLAENQLGKLRAKNRSTVSASRTSPAVSDEFENDMTINIRFFSSSVNFVNQLSSELHQWFVLARSVLVKHQGNICVHGFACVCFNFIFF